MREVRDDASRAGKKNVRPARIARFFARCEMKQLCCYINPDFSVKVSHVSEHSDMDFTTRKKKIMIKSMIKCLLTELGQARRENIWPEVTAYV